MRKRKQTIEYKAACAALKALDADLTIHQRSQLAYAAIAACICFSNSRGELTFLPTTEIPTNERS